MTRLFELTYKRDNGRLNAWEMLQVIVVLTLSSIFAAPLYLLRYFQGRSLLAVAFNLIDQKEHDALRMRVKELEAQLAAD